MIFTNIQSFPINWENGMKLSSDHFRHLEDSIEDSIRDTRSTALITSHAYGLLPNSPFTLRNATGHNNQTVRVILSACRAILPGGHRVEILPENIQSLKLPVEAPAVEFIHTPGTRYHLFLTVDENERVSGGIPETRPIRHPYLCHNYQLECIAHDKLNSVSAIAANRMKIGEWQDGKIIEGYIPPTLTVSGFPLLEKWHQFFTNQLENIAKIGTLVVTKQRKREVARAEFCEPLVSYIRSSQAYYKWMLPNESPLWLAVYFGNLAGLVEGLIETSDQDFVRNFLKNGQLNELGVNIARLKNMNQVQVDDMANVITNIKRFIDSLVATIRALGTTDAPAPRSGDRKIVSG